MRLNSITALTRTYYINSGSIAYTFNEFTLNVTCDDKVITYSALLSNGSSLPAFITFNSSSRTFTCSSSSTSDLGTYVITVTGTANSLYTTTATITITVSDPCPTATFSSPSNPST